MTDNELLLAMSNMIDPLRNDIQDIRNDVQEVKTQVQNLDNRVKKIELTQEIEIIPRLQNIEACYTSTYERYKNSVDDYETMKQDVSMLKKVVSEHSKKLQNIS